jgi:hypothetical protein
MSIYPEEITQDILLANEHLSDQEVMQDILDTKKEINLLNEKMTDLQMDIDEREEFVNFLNKFLDARKQQKENENG